LLQLEKKILLNQHLCDYLDNFTRQSIAQREEIGILGATLNDLAKEKECLQACLDKKSENIASLGESLAMKVCSDNCGGQEMFKY
jgi:hypothetical protein